MNKIIAIDGSAGSGKTSISKLFSKYINYFYLETGLIYRGLAHYFITNKISYKDPQRVEAEFQNIKLEFLDEGSIYINGEDVTEKLRSNEINDLVPLYAQLPSIRKFSRTIQKKVAGQRDTVVDGRDIGTVVFPEAFCKFYLEAKTDVRAKRRQEQLKEKGIEKTLEEIKVEILKRDYYDKTREQSPLKVSHDAYLIDTSEISIDEVLQKMITYYNKQMTLIEGSSGNESNEMMRALAASQDAQVLDQYLKATVVKIGKEIIMDVGDKVDAYIDEKEVGQLKVQLGELPKVGDRLDVFKVKRSSRGILVSMLRANQEQSRIKLAESFANKEIVKGSVKTVIKGGFIIDINGLDAFCPYSEYDVVNVNTDKQVGVLSNFEILDFSPKNIVVSRKRPLQKELSVVHEKFFQELEPGDVLSVEVVKLFDYGVLAKVSDGINILIRNKDLLWKFFRNSHDYFKEGDRFDVKVMNIVDDPKFTGGKRIEASKRELEDDPFDIFVATHQEGDIIEGEVKRIEAFGAFLELSDGVDALLRINDLTWLARVQNIEDYIQTGQKLKVKITTILKQERKIAVGLKQMEPNPWDTMETIYPIGSMLDVKVTGVDNNGVYGQVIDSDQKLEAFIHPNDTPYKDDPNAILSEKFKEGDEVRVRVYAINKRKQRLELEIKEQTGDVWKDFSLDYKEGNVVRGEVIEYVENGANVKVQDEIIGFVHVSQITDKENPVVEDEIKVGETYNFVIQLISPEAKSLKLSIREYLANQNKSAKNYMNNDTSSGIKLGDLLN